LLVNRKSGTKNPKSRFFPLIFAPQNIDPMATSTAADRRKYWMYFLIFFVIFMLMLIFMNQWFWVAMPFMLTFLVMALGYM